MDDGSPRISPAEDDVGGDEDVDEVVVEEEGVGLGLGRGRGLGLEAWIEISAGSPSPAPLLTTLSPLRFGVRGRSQAETSGSPPRQPGDRHTSHHRRLNVASYDCSSAACRAS